MKLFVVIDVPENWEDRLDMQQIIEREITADRWGWQIAPPESVPEPPPVSNEFVAPGCEQFGSDGVVGEVLAELAKAVKKFPTWPTDPLHALAVLGEEYGELNKAVLQSVYEPHKVKADEVRTEAMQTAAMALRFLVSLDAYEYTRGEQHSQNVITKAETMP